jgi:hypothetical protein
VVLLKPRFAGPAYSDTVNIAQQCPCSQSPVTAITVSRADWAHNPTSFIHNWSCSMCSPRNISVSARRSANVALHLVDEHEQRLRAILESAQVVPDEKFQALADLASLTGILVREMAEAEAETLLR